MNHHAALLHGDAIGMIPGPEPTKFIRDFVAYTWSADVVCNPEPALLVLGKSFTISESVPTLG